jgi:hypothetical protein
VWRENGVRKTRTVRRDGPGEYDVTTDVEPVDESIETAVPSR